ncbi:hypothetical protein QWY28_13435 [Nocardioides sp. SOB77]|uniref:Uncharacterized protein n=1 Tax=Nocardioides oceani TaxID=3058369 RepID=A0ABT8FGY6_9ACTN|nr:hypothetical protein [Nocardioides oceani]MDN4173958.1 hypothetical protein [Nocardioides oceani]
MTTEHAGWAPARDPFLNGDPVVPGTDPQAVVDLIEAGLPHCGRPFNHGRHEYLDSDCASRWCRGGKPEPLRTVAELVAIHPALAGVGVVPAIAELGTWCA